MSSRDHRLLLAALTFVGVVCVLPITLGAPPDLLLAAPVLLLALPLIAGRYIGEEQLVRFVAQRPVVRLRAALRLGALRAPAALLPRGGALLARSLAVRPPPAALGTR